MAKVSLKAVLEECKRRGISFAREKDDFFYDVSITNLYKKSANIKADMIKLSRYVEKEMGPMVSSLKVYDEKLYNQMKKYMQEIKSGILAAQGSAERMKHDCKMIKK